MRRDLLEQVEAARLARRTRRPGLLFTATSLRTDVGTVRSRVRPTSEEPHGWSTSTRSATASPRLSEVITLGRTLKKRAADVLAYFERPGTSNGPTEAINGRLEHLRGSALGFRNLTNYIARSLLKTGGFRPRLHPRS